VTQLDVASGFEGGLAVVILAIYLDRLTAALAEPRRRTATRRVQPAPAAAEPAPKPTAHERDVVAA
jgi:glycine betaine/proline transport system permease protein